MPATLKLTIANEAKVVRSAYLDWYRVLRTGSKQEDTYMRVGGTDVCFRRIARHRHKVHLDFWLGSSHAAAVQLNQPGVAGTENPGTTIAVGSRGRRYLVRQGDLYKNSASARIAGVKFTESTGSEPVMMLRGLSPARKQWHVVARLDGRSDASILADTSEFVRRCWNARTFGAKAAEDQKRLAALFGKPERGGWYDLDPALVSKRVVKVQGYVSECLEVLLAQHDIELRKPRHAANYEVDGTVDGPGGRILIEIKTGVSAADVYAGVGQLTIYPIILPDLADHRRVLLLPGRPGADLTQALANCRVELHSYELTRRGKSASARFGVSLLRLCGIPERRITDLVASGKALP